MLSRKFDEYVSFSGSGEIDYDEFFEMIGDQRTPYTDALFELIDADGSGAIDFTEYIQVLSTYCMYSKDDVLSFCFRTFDKDGSGNIDENEYIAIMKSLNNGNPMFPGNFGRACTDFDVNDDGLIDFNEFKEMYRMFPIVFFPAFRLQNQMWKATLGQKRWLKIHELLHKDSVMKEYMSTHGGQTPALTFVEKLTQCFTRKHPHSRWLSQAASASTNHYEDLREEDDTEKKARAIEEKRRLKRILKVDVKAGGRDSGRTPGSPKSPKKSPKSPKSPNGGNKPLDSVKRSKNNSSMSSIANAQKRAKSMGDKKRSKNNMKSPKSSSSKVNPT